MDWRDGMSWRGWVVVSGKLVEDHCMNFETDPARLLIGRKFCSRPQKTRPTSLRAFVNRLPKKEIPCTVSRHKKSSD